jgi:cellulose synthase (UDP-forming)
MVVMYTRVSTHKCPASCKNYLTCLQFLPKSAAIREFRGIQGVSSVYTCRVHGLHAKAGNVNNGLAHALAVGRRPEFVLLLDADFAANRQILQRTLGLFEAADVAIVQTPQHFFNPDPIQSSLLGSKVWPDEQRFFFNFLLEAKDAWGAAFCCGTSAVVRVAALERIGGMAA